MIKNKGRTKPLYDLEYHVGGRISQTIDTAKPIHIVNWKKQVLEDGNNYKLGKLKIKRNKMPSILKGSIK